MTTSEARRQFLEDGGISAEVRPEIARAWARARRAGFTADGDWSVDLVEVQSSPVSRAFDAEADLRVEVLTREGLAILLVGLDGRVLASRGTTQTLDTGWPAVPRGARLDEATIGAHAAALALYSGRAEVVTGHEHLHPRYVDGRTVAVPLADPASGRELGLIVVETVDPHAGLLLAWAQEFASAVVGRLELDRRGRGSLLLASFVAAQATSRRPVLCLDEQTLICNAAATRILGSEQQALLWEHASRFLRTGQHATTLVHSADGSPYEARFEPILDGDARAGVRISLHPVPPQDEEAADVLSKASELVSALPGSGLRWRSFVADLDVALSQSDRVVLVGEPGTGKSHVARALLGPGAFEIDGSSETACRELVRRRGSHSRPLLVTHLERLSDETIAEMGELLRGARHPESPVVLTLTQEREDHGSLTPRGSGLGPWVRVPALRDRLDDLPQLVRAFTVHDPETGAPSVRWMQDALQLLARVDWPENLRSLHSVVDLVNQRCQTGYVDASALPESVRVRATGRRLSRLEQMEALEILVALREVGGNKLLAAERLGIARSTLYRRMKALGIDPLSANY